MFECGTSIAPFLSTSMTAQNPCTDNSSLKYLATACISDIIDGREIIGVVRLEQFLLQSSDMRFVQRFLDQQAGVQRPAVTVVIIAALLLCVQHIKREAVDDGHAAADSAPQDNKDIG